MSRRARLEREGNTVSDQARIKGHTVTRTVHIEASRARVWKALTDPEVMVKWFGDGVVFTALEPGATGSIDWDDYGSFPIEITEVVPDGSFGFRWSGIPAEQLDEYSTHVRFTVADAGSGRFGLRRLRQAHSRYDDDQCVAAGRCGGVRGL